MVDRARFQVALRAKDKSVSLYDPYTRARKPDVKIEPREGPAAVAVVRFVGEGWHCTLNVPVTAEVANSGYLMDVLYDHARQAAARELWRRSRARLIAENN